MCPSSSLSSVSPQQFHRYPNENDPYSYWLCTNDYAGTLIRCSDGLVFSAEHGRCEMGGIARFTIISIDSMNEKFLISLVPLSNPCRGLHSAKTYRAPLWFSRSIYIECDKKAGRLKSIRSCTSNQVWLSEPLNRCGTCQEAAAQSQSLITKDILYGRNCRNLIYLNFPRTIYLSSFSMFFKYHCKLLRYMFKL